MKYKIYLGLIALSINGFAQQNPTPNPSADPSVSLPGPQKGEVAWYRGGNVNGGLATNKKPKF